MNAPISSLRRLIVPLGLAAVGALTACPQPASDGGKSAGAKSAGTPTTPSSPATPAAAAAPSSGTKKGRLPDSHVVAKWKGGQLTYGELRAGGKQAFTKLENKFATDLYNLELEQVEQQVISTLIEAEAKKAGKSDREFLQTVVPPAPVTEAEILAFYDKNVRQSGQPLDALKDRIRAFVGQQKQQEAIKKYIDDLKSKSNVAITVPMPDIEKAQFDLAGRPMAGKESAKITIVEFSDFECPYCARATDPVKKILAAYPDDVKVYFMHFPLSFHKNAMPAAVASQCANKQGKFWPMHDSIFAAPKALNNDKFIEYAKNLKLDVAMFEACLKDPTVAAFVQADMKQGEKAGVSGTPSFFINGIPYPRGVPSVEAIKPYLGGS